MGRVAGVDWQRQQVLLDDGSTVGFDYLVLAPGVIPAFAGVPGAAAYAIPLKQVTDATQLRNRLLRSFETAAAHPPRQPPAIPASRLSRAARPASSCRRAERRPMNQPAAAMAVVAAAPSRLPRRCIADRGGEGRR